MKNNYYGRQCLDVSLLKPARFRAQTDLDGPQPQEAVVEYEYGKSHPILRWLPSKLAEWIGDNYGMELGIPPRADTVENKWSVDELNAILANNLVSSAKGQLRTFGCIQWECELFNGRPKARCYPFDLKQCRFRGGNPQVGVYLYIM